MAEEKNIISLQYKVNGEDFSLAGEASSNVKKILKQLGVNPEAIRRVAIAMYEGEINMVIHAKGGIAEVNITPEQIKVLLQDEGPGIADIELAMQEGYSTAPDNIRELGFGAGMGLPNMKRYSDEMKINSVVGKGTRVELIFNI
ncbi:MAG: serine/threonine-protein kinase RsbT [Clostridiales bacterium]|jgi:anti-sigma regulatory factor (Ser/Thr protein kinase)|nr:serine/threonine-protein kinase RsbT [Clostridiales bacterium]MDK2934091.1 serine/threonine-protein kinase RsbT [Clostridiales bacterium]